MVWGVEEVVGCCLGFCTRYLQGTDNNVVVFFFTLNLRKVWTDLDEILYRAIHRKCCGKNLVLILNGPVTAFVLLPIGRRAECSSVGLLRSVKFQKTMLIDMEHDFAVTKRIFQLKRRWLIHFYLYLLDCVFRLNPLNTELNPICQ